MAHIPMHVSLILKIIPFYEWHILLLIPSTLNLNIIFNGIYYFNIYIMNICVCILHKYLEGRDSILLIRVLPTSLPWFVICLCIYIYVHTHRVNTFWIDACKLIGILTLSSLSQLPLNELKLFLYEGKQVSVSVKRLYQLSMFIPGCHRLDSGIV